MRIFTLPDSSTVGVDDQFQIGDQKYPHGWLHTATTDEIAQAGIVVTEVQDPILSPVVPSSISAMQAKVMLSRAGLLPSVQAWIDNQDAETKLIWATASNFSRTSQLVLRAAQALNLSDQQVDQLFITAATIEP